MIRKALIAIALVAGGCAQPPVASPQADQMAKGFPTPEPGKGALYVYRSGVMGVARPIDVQIVGGATAQLPHRQLHPPRRPAGPDRGRLQGRRQDRRRPGQIGEGRTRYVEVSMKVGLP